jgi:hypothetical protein
MAASTMNIELQVEGKLFRGWHPRRLVTLLAITLIIPMSSRSEDAIATRLGSILNAYDKREAADDSTASHQKWLATPSGQADVVFLSENYERLSPDRKGDVPMELARTGMDETLPLIKSSLADPKFGPRVFPGLFYACRVSSDNEEKFRKEAAEGLVPWVKADGSDTSRKAIEVLPFLDSGVAAKTLMHDDFLSPTSPSIHAVLSSCNEAAITFPLPRIRQWLEVWKPAAKDVPQDHQIPRLYREAVIALAAHHPDEAMKLAKAAVARNPEEGDFYHLVPLAAAGLTGLYDHLCDLQDDEAKFQSLPEAAKIYFALTYFEADSENGGIGQALGNSTGDLLPLVKKGYQVVGDSRGGSYLVTMLKPFGPNGPSLNRGERVRQMENMEPDYWTQEEELGEKWAKEWNDKPRTSTSWLLSLYAFKHAPDLKPLIARP